MKKLIFALPFLLFSMTGCSSNTTIGKAAGLKAKDVIWISVVETWSTDPERYVLADEYIEEFAPQLLNMPIKRTSSPCKCISKYSFDIIVKEKSYRFHAYAFHNDNKAFYYTTDDANYESLLNYVIERAVEN